MAGVQSESARFYTGGLLDAELRYGEGTAATGGGLCL